MVFFLPAEGVPGIETVGEYIALIAVCLYFMDVCFHRIYTRHSSGSHLEAWS